MSAQRLRQSRARSAGRASQAANGNPPVILGGAFPWAARRAIRYGDGWYQNAASGNPEEYLPAFRKMAQDAGARSCPSAGYHRRRTRRSRQAETVPRPRRCADQCQPDVGSSRRHPPDIGQVGWLHPPTARLRRRQVRWNSGNRPAPRAVRPAGVAYFSRRRRSRTSIREVLTLVQKSSRGGKSSLSDAGVSGGAVPLVAI